MIQLKSKNKAQKNKLNFYQKIKKKKKKKE